MGSFTNWRGISPENSLSRYNDSFFNKSFRRAWDNDFSIDQTGITPPAINVREEDTGFLLEFAVPGYQKSDFDIQIQDRVLTISAEREKTTTPETNENQKSEERTHRYTRREFHYQTFSRSFTLPDNAKEDQITAHYHNGILAVKVPVEGRVKEQESRRSISVG